MEYYSAFLLVSGRRPGGDKVRSAPWPALWRINAFSYDCDLAQQLVATAPCLPALKLACSRGSKLSISGVFALLAAGMAAWPGLQLLALRSTSIRSEALTPGDAQQLQRLEGCWPQLRLFSLQRTWLPDEALCALAPLTRHWTQLDTLILGLITSAQLAWRCWQQQAMCGQHCEN